MSTTVEKIRPWPICDLCRKDEAYADAYIPGGGWADVCKTCFQDHGCKLGTGCGQRFIVPKIKAKKPMKQPNFNTLRRWMDDGIAKAKDGCKVEPDGECPHGCKSWLLHLGLI